MNPKKLFFILMLLTLTLGLAACIPEDSSPLRAWIDYPIEGETLPVGEAIQVILHGYAREGLADALLTVNGEAYRREAFATPGADFGELRQEWHPAAEGVYTLQVIVYDVSGAASLPASVSVTVGGAALAEPAPTGGECAPDALVAPLLVAPADGATLAPDPRLEWAYPDESCHPHSYAIDISEDSSFADIRWGFGTLDYTETSRIWPLPAGQCYYWRARAYAPDAYGPESGVRSFCVEETSATLTPTLETVEAATCPPVATTLAGSNCRTGPGPGYPVVASFTAGHSATVLGRNAESSWWVLENAGGSCWIWDDLVTLNTNTCTVPVQAAPPLPPTNTPTPTVTPTVTPTTPAPDTTPPPVPAPQNPANDSVVACANSVTLNWSAVTDPSGIAVYYIKLEKELTAGNWQSAGGYTSGTNSVNVPVNCGLRYRWFVRAEDGAGNLSAWSAPAVFGVGID